MKKWYVFLVIAVLALALFKCKDDGDNSGSGGINVEKIANAVSNPTGTVSDAETAQGVADAFAAKMESMSSTSAGGEESGSGTVACPNGGDITANADSSGNGSFSYNACCYEAGCCVDGKGEIAQGTGDYAMCASYSLELDCGEASGEYTVDFCNSADGNIWYVVEYEGKSYACAGNYSSEYGGSWTIRDSSATWECEASCSDGTCTGSCTDGTDSYTW